VFYHRLSWKTIKDLGKNADDNLLMSAHIFIFDLNVPLFVRARPKNS